MTAENLDYMVAEALKDAPADTILDLTMEPTNIVWRYVATYLSKKYPQIKLYRVKTAKVNALRKYLHQHTKTDPIDSKTLAKMQLIDPESLDELYLSDAKIITLDQNNKQRARIVKELSRIKKSISDQLSLGYIGLSDCFSCPFTEPFLKFIAGNINPFKIVKLGKERLTKKLEKFGFKDENISQLADRLYQQAVQTTKLYLVESNIDYKAFQRRIRREVSIFRAFQSQLDKVDSEIDQDYKELDPDQNLQTIPGVGKQTAAASVGIIGNPERFKETKSFQGFVGFVPKIDDSGNTSKKGLPMTKAGPNLLKGYIYMASDAARKYDPQLAKIYYDQMVLKGNTHTQALCAVSKHIAARIVVIYKENRPYELRDVDGKSITKKEGYQIVKEQYTVSEEVRKRLRNRKSRKNKREYQSRSSNRQLSSSIGNRR